MAPLSSSVTRGLSSGGNEADDEYDDDESVFAPVVIGVTSSIRWVGGGGVFRCDWSGGLTGSC